MFIKVKLLSGNPEPLLYAIPESWQKKPIAGTLVKIPLRNRFVSGVVIETLQNKPSVAFVIKAATEIQVFPEDPFYLPFIKKLAQYYQLDETTFLKRVQSFFKVKPLKIETKEVEQSSCQEVMLTSEQLAATNYLSEKISCQEFAPTVLHGVTGSGKTEVYKKAILDAFTQNKTSLLMLPEVTLATRFEQILKQQLPSEIPIFGFHSATGAKNKKLLWHNLLNKKAQLIIGVHLPVLLPIPNLGLIIIDEEHEVGYQEKKHPKINTKEAAIMRAQISNIPLVLGSATPSLPTLHNVKTRGWKLFQLKKRFAGAFPKIEFVHLLDKKKRKNFWLSDKLIAALKKQFVKKEQTILFLNRRGMSFFVQCKNCSFVFCCTSCSVSLTLHADNSLRCHYCNFQMMQPERCTECGDTEFLRKGIGTQQVVSILQKMFPQARIARADLDATVNRIGWQKTMEDFQNQKLDILVGTQTITKGYHFPNVTLVGILWGDINLNIPQYNSQETTLQQLIQVAGRAGRQRPDSLVIVQAMQNHPIFNFVNEIDYLKFYEQELAQRAEVGYPPLKRFAEIELKHTKELIVEEEADHLAMELMQSKDVLILGPAQPPVAKIKKIFSRKIYLKADGFNQISIAFQKIDKKKFKSKIYFTPNPL
jgi:primosomal protein N' (replication factor Y)